MSTRSNNADDLFVEPQTPFRAHRTPPPPPSSSSSGNNKNHHHTHTAPPQYRPTIEECGVSHSAENLNVLLHAFHVMQRSDRRNHAHVLTYQLFRELASYTRFLVPVRLVNEKESSSSTSDDHDDEISDSDLPHLVTATTMTVAQSSLSSPLSSSSSSPPLSPSPPLPSPSSHLSSPPLPPLSPGANRMVLLFTEAAKWQLGAQAVGVTSNNSGDDKVQVRLKRVPSIQFLMRHSSDLCVNLGSPHDLFICEGASFDALRYWDSVLALERDMLKQHLNGGGGNGNGGGDGGNGGGNGGGGNSGGNGGGNGNVGDRTSGSLLRVLRESTAHLWVVLDHHHNQQQQQQKLKSMGPPTLKIAPLKDTGGKRYVLAFTAPDLAFQFAQLFQVDASRVKPVPGRVLLDKMAASLEANANAFDGIVFNFGNRVPPGHHHPPHTLPNPEIILTSSSFMTMRRIEQVV